MVKHIESGVHAALLEGFSPADLARKPGVPRHPIQKMVAAGQAAPRR